MAQIIPVIVAAVTVAGTVYSSLSASSDLNKQAAAQNEAAAAQEAAANQTRLLEYENAARTEQVGFREAELLQKANTQEQSANLARAAASGVSVDDDDDDNSVSLFLKEQVNTGKEELDWLRNVTAFDASSIRKTANINFGANISKSNYTRALASITKSKANSALVSGAISAVGGIASAAGGAYSSYNSIQSQRISALDKGFLSSSTKQGLSYGW